MQDFFLKIVYFHFPFLHFYLNIFQISFFIPHFWGF
jgi:hypothetical protein